MVERRNLFRIWILCAAVALFFFAYNSILFLVNLAPFISTEPPGLAEATEFGAGMVNTSVNATISFFVLLALLLVGFFIFIVFRKNS